MNHLSPFLPAPPWDRATSVTPHSRICGPFRTLSGRTLRPLPRLSRLERQHGALVHLVFVRTDRDLAELLGLGRFAISRSAERHSAERQVRVFRAPLRALVSQVPGLIADPAGPFSVRPARVARVETRAPTATLGGVISSPAPNSGLPRRGCVTPPRRRRTASRRLPCAGPTTFPPSNLSQGGAPIWWDPGGFEGVMGRYSTQ